MNKDYSKEIDDLKDRAIMVSIMDIYDRLDNISKYLEIIDKYIDKMKQE